MIYLAVAVWVFMGTRLLIATVNLLTRQWLPSASASGNAKVSVLIPARNEAHTISHLLSGLLSQDYINWHAIVYDDLSEDKTAEVVKYFQEKDPRIKLIKGKELPHGWLGKNFACYQLARQADGEYLLFIDADVRLEKTLIRDALAHLQKHKLELLSVFPQQIMVSRGEKISVPIMNWVLVSLLPLILTRTSSMPAFAAANGQHMLFKTTTYRQMQFHERFKNHAVEDIAIARYMKKQKLRIHTLLSNGQIKCRMYFSLKEAINGFSKNILAFFGNSIPASIIILIITSLGIIPVYLASGVTATIIYLISALLLRLLVAVVSRQNLLDSIITAPVQQIIFCIMIIKAIYKRYKRKNTWKGRIINV
jgi:glycosyltransferase involved in cell wall biosynthesis